VRKGVAFLAIIVIIAVVAVIGGGGYVVAKKFGNSEERSLEFVGPSPRIRTRPSPSPPATASPSPTVLPSPSPSPTGPSIYTDSVGKYSINLPSGWIVNSKTRGAGYTSVKFTGPTGNISITIGSGKDPAGGCSETTKITLFDRTIDGCFLLQKDGSQILTRVYTKNSAGVDITVEAYFNPPVSTNRPLVIEVVKTIDIN